MTTTNGYGYVYCLTNKTTPGFCKIGYTNDCPENRAKQLCTTGVLEEFKVEFSIYVEDARTAEKHIHKKLKDKRVYPKKEFFDCTPDEAKIHFDEYVNNCKPIAKPVYEPNTYIVKNDMEAIDIILKDLIGILVFSKGEIYYKKENIWHLLRANKELSFFVLNYNFIKYTDVKKQIVYNKNINTIKKFCNSIVMKIELTPANHIDDFKKVMYESTLGKICFNNGVYDFSSREFKSWSDISNVYTPFIIKRNYDPNVENYKEEMKHCDKILKTLFNNKYFVNFKEFLSVIIAGYTYDSIRIVLFNDAYTSYDFLTCILEKLFETNYIFSKDLDSSKKYDDDIPVLSRILLHNYVYHKRDDDDILFYRAYGIKEHYYDIINKIDHQFTIWLSCYIDDFNEYNRYNIKYIFKITDEEMLNKLPEQNIREIIDNLKLLLSTNNKYINALTTIIFNAFPKTGIKYKTF